MACIVENMLLASTDLGLGSIYLTSFLRGVEKRKDLLEDLEIPKAYKPISAVGVGYIKGETKGINLNSVANRIKVVRK